MFKHNTDIILCSKLVGNNIGKLCDKCDGRCPICDSYVKPFSLVRICDDCSNQSLNNEKCIVCGYPGKNEAYFCKSCVILEKDREGCPKVINLGVSRKDYIFNKKVENNFKNKFIN